MKTRIFLTAFLFLQITAVLYPQNFKVSPLIDIPGDNLEFDISSPGLLFPYEVYICWLNKLDSAYTIYLRQLSPAMGAVILMASDNTFKSRVQVSQNYNSSSIRIAWQSFEAGLWRIISKEYLSGVVTDSAVLVDSLQNDPEMTLSNTRIAWIENGNLFVKEFYPVLSDKIIFDSVNCSSPDLMKNDYLQSTNVVYQKNYSDSSDINYIYYMHNENHPPVLDKTILSHGEVCANPEFGLMNEVTFGVFQNDLWKCRYGWDWRIENYKTTTNTQSNYKNGCNFTYPMVTDKLMYTPFFLAFDSDSIPGNKEIFLLENDFTMYWENSFINLSDASGDDTNPMVFIVSEADTNYIIVAWYHTESGKTDIWIAKDKFLPNWGAVNDFDENLSFQLLQNYPNPFNPTTTIEYILKERTRVKISVLNLLGEETALLVNEEKEAGNYQINFNGDKFSGGVYFYRMSTGSRVVTKKMILMK